MRKRQLGHMDLSGVFWIALGLGAALLLGGAAIGWAGWSLWTGARNVPQHLLSGLVLAIGVCLIAGAVYLALYVAPIFR